MINKSLFTSNKDDWCTPPELFNKLNSIYHFTVDLCASDTNHLCSKYFTKDNSCLNYFFSNEVIFCNPPYGRSISKFVKHCFLLSSCNTVVLLLPARTDTIWFHKYIYYYADNIIFLKGRLKFSGSKNSAPFPSMVVVFNSFPKFCH